MAVEVEIVGNGYYQGARSAISTYTVSEQSTPIEASDTTGGVGQIRFNATDDPSRLGSMLLLNDTVKLLDNERGDTEGTINEVTSNDRILSIAADSRLGKLVVDKRASSYTGTFGGLMTYYLGLCGISTGIAVDSAISTVPVIAPGWFGDVWSHVKQACISVGAEVTLIRGNITFRPVRSNKAVELNNVTESWTISNTDLAQNVEVAYYNTAWKVDQLVYPAGGWNEDVRVYTVDAGQVITVNIPVDVTIQSIEAPGPVATVSKEETLSGYSVVGNDGTPISPDMWLGNNGLLTVTIGEDQHSLDVTIIGAEGAAAEFAPYRIAVSAGDNEYYSSLRVRGTGMHFTRETVIVPTGADATVTARDVGVTVDNPFIATRAQALNLALDVAARWATPRRTINISKAIISAPTDAESSAYDYATFAQFDAYAAANGITTFAQFDTAWSGKTFAQFDQYWFDLVDDQFAFQIFGNANGARLQFRRAMYRIRSIDISQDAVSYTAEADTTFADFDASAGASMTFAQFDTLYSGLTFNDFALIPLPTVKPEYDR